MRQVTYESIARVASYLLLLVSVIPSPVGAAYSQWEWQAVGIVDNHYLSIVYPGPSTTFATKEEALSALRSPGGFRQVLTKFTGARRSMTGGIDYFYAAPDVDMIFGVWKYNVLGNLPCPQVESEAVLLNCLADYYENQRCPNGVTISIPPVSSWISIPDDSRGHEGGSTSFSAPDCGLNNWTLGIERWRDLSCPDGYIVWGPGPRCTNGYAAVVRSRPLECPTGSPTGSVGNPCNAVTGDKFQAETDYRAPGLTFTRSYHSAALGADASLGLGWTHNFASKMLIDQGTPKILVRPNGYHESLEFGQSISGSGTRVVQSGSEWLVYLSNGDVETYTIGGELTRIADRSRLITTLAYANDPVSSKRRLNSVVGPFGHRVDLAYTGERLSSITNSAGITTQYTYDANDNLLRVAYAGGLFREYLYEDSRFPNHMTGIIDEAGVRFSTYTYDSIGRAVRTEHANASEWHEITYGVGSSTVLSAAGLQTVFSYGGLAIQSPRITNVSRGGLNTSFQFSFGSQRRISQQTDPRGIVTKFTYNDDHLLSKTEAFGTAKARATSYTYRSYFDDLPTQITEVGRTTSFSYDPVTGSLLTKTITDTTVVPNVARTWTYTYNASGQVLTEDGPRTDVADVTTFDYYSCVTGAQCGQLHTITNALSHVTTYNSYNANGQPTEIANANGLVMTLAYDVRQRPTHRCLGSALPACLGGELTAIDYWPTGFLRKVTNPDGSFIEYTYDDAHRLTEIEDSAGNRIVFTLDAMGNRTAENTYDSAGTLKRTHSRVFNTLNQVWKEVNAPGTAAVTTTFGYDANGNQTTVSAPLGRSSTNLYDELDRLTQITDPNSGITLLGFNAHDHLTSATDPNALVTSYQVNGFGETTLLSSPDTGQTTSTYDSAGNLKTRTDARGAVSLVTFTYDALNRPTQVLYTDQTINYVYDSCLNGIGRLCRFTDNSGSTSYEYDPHGRVTKKTQIANTSYAAVTRVVRYQHTNGNLTRLTMPSGALVDYGYDAAGRVGSVTVTPPGGLSVPLVSNVLYDPFGGVRGWTWSNGSIVTRETDLDGRISQIASFGTTSYSYDDADRITGMTAIAGNPGPSWAFGYDNLDRLTAANHSTYSSGYSYDANGNRLTQTGTIAATYSYPMAGTAHTSNRTQTVSGGTVRNYLYDAAGNITRDAWGGCCTTTLGYDGAGRMTNVSLYGDWRRYNALGQRTARLTMAYTYDESGQYLENCSAGGSQVGGCNPYFQQEYIWLGDIPVGAILPRVEYDEEGYEDFFARELHDVHTDHLNTPRRVTRSSDGVMVWSWDGDAFGVGYESANLALGYYVPYDLRLPGQLQDYSTGRRYNYFRDYDPFTGRYSQSDPIGLGGGINTYAYVRGNPVSFTDPLGLHVEMAFNRSTGRLVAVDVDTKEMVSIFAFSGLEGCTNNSECDPVEGTGPIPKGPYLIGKGHDRGTGGDDWWYKLYGSNGSGGYSYTQIPVKDPATGNITMRGGFNLHTGSWSLGCLTVLSDVDRSSPEYPRSDAYDRLKKLLDNTTPYMYNGDPYRGRLNVK